MAVTDRHFYIYMICSHAVDNFFASQFYKIATDKSYFRKKILYLSHKKLFDSIVAQNAEIRTVANSQPLLLK